MTGLGNWPQCLRCHFLALQFPASLWPNNRAWWISMRGGHLKSPWNITLVNVCKHGYVYVCVCVCVCGRCRINTTLMLCCCSALSWVSGWYRFLWKVYFKYLIYKDYFYLLCVCTCVHASVCVSVCVCACLCVCVMQIDRLMSNWNLAVSLIYFLILHLHFHSILPSCLVPVCCFSYKTYSVK